MSETQSPEEIRREIEQTRANLGETLHDIEDRVSPSRIKERRTEAVKSRWRNVKESVMGTSDDVRYQADQRRQQVSGAASGAASQLSDAASGAVDTVKSAPDQAMNRARGNPLAAGLVAFGGGLLLASVLPATQREQEAASTLKDRYAEPVKQQLQEVGQQAKEGLQGTAQQAVQEVKSTAQEAVQNTKSEAQSSAQSVRGDAQGAAEQVRSS
jgi:gas vesicle protein